MEKQDKNMTISLFILTIACLAPSFSQSMTEGDRIQKYLEKLAQSGYNKQIRPESSNGPGEPIKVTCSMYILDITKVDETNMEFRATFYFRQTWNDTRLAYTDPDMEKSVVLNDPKYVWTPDLFFVEEREGIRHDLITPNVFIRIYKHGAVFFSVRMSSTFRCPMDFRKYPHDTQKCTFGIESFGFSRAVLAISWVNDPVGMNNTIDLLPFKITDIKEGIKEESTTVGVYTTLLVELTFQRKVGLFITKLYFPYIFLVILSWLSFWIPAKLLAPRLALLLVILYLMVNIGEDINHGAPKSSYTKASDVWIAVCKSLIFAALLEFMAAHIIAKNEDSRQKSLGQKDPETQNVLDTDSKINPVNIEPSNSAMRMIVSRLKSGLLSSNIDKASSILFPILFILFNCVYWIVYCSGN